MGGPAGAAEGMAKAPWERDNLMGSGRKGAAGSADGVNVMTAPAATWMRLARRLGRDGNPLRRRADVLQGWLLPAVIAAFLILCPLVACAAGLWVRAGNAAARHAQLWWHRVPAVLLQAAAGPVRSGDGARSWLAWTPARWTAAGRPQIGNVPALAGTRAGSTVPVWLDRAGKVRMPPLTAAQASDHVVVAMLIASAGLAVILAAMALLARRVLDRRRLEGWETAWLSVGPQWSRQG